MSNGYAEFFFQFGVGVVAFCFLLTAFLVLVVVGHCGVEIVRWIRGGGVRVTLFPPTDTRSEVAAPTDYDMWMREQEEKRVGR